MSDTLLVWAVPAAIGLHNLEEAVWLPSRSKRAPERWSRPVNPFAFRFAVLVLTVLAIGLGVWTRAGGPGSLGHLLLASFALGQSINVIFPHFVATIATRSLAPGLLTGVVFVLPSASAMTYWTLVVNDVQLRDLLVVSAIFVPLVLLSVPVLLWIGGVLQRALATLRPHH